MSEREIKGIFCDESPCPKCKQSVYGEPPDYITVKTITDDNSGKLQVTFDCRSCNKEIVGYSPKTHWQIIWGSVKGDEDNVS